jgi:hypothetical protein
VFDDGLLRPTELTVTKDFLENGLNRQSEGIVPSSGAQGAGFLQ